MYEFRVATHGDIMVVDGWGPWDRATVTAYADAVVSAAQRMPFPWASLIRFRSEPLMWGETRDDIKQAVLRRVELGMRRLAVVMDEIPEANLVRAQYAELYRECGIAYAFFGSDEHALAWLAEQGYGSAIAEIRAAAWRDAPPDSEPTR